MSIQIGDVFNHPYEVTAFWASSNYRYFRKPFGDPYVDLVTNHPEPGQWALLVCAGEDEPYVGEVVPPFLPTRSNIRHLNDEARRAAPVLDHVLATQDYDWPPGVPALLPDLERAPSAARRDLREPAYQEALWRVLWRDWGMELPAPAALGREDIRLLWRAGLPCAPAMEKAARYVLEAFFGELTLERVSLVEEGGRVFDLAEYRGATGLRRQRFDITELYGRELATETFDFEGEG